MWMSAIFVLCGAELNSEIEHQTALDTAVGRPKPPGPWRSGGRYAGTAGSGRAERTLASRINNNAKLAALGEVRQTCANGFSRFSEARGLQELRALRAT
jgi:hypothetical protein